MSAIVLTGVGGFVGGYLNSLLTDAGHRVISVSKSQCLLGGHHLFDPSLQMEMKDAQSVIHLAARAHVIVERHKNALEEFRRVNVDGTLAVAEMAVRARVARFVFVSSIGVLGNASGSRTFEEGDAPAPVEPYAVSKWEAEQALRSLGEKWGLEIVVVRPPLVYGPRVKGNFLRLLRLLNMRVPLPFGSIHNCRSYIGVHNLCDLLASCAFHPAANGRTFHVADGEDVSTPELLQLIAAAMGHRARIFRCPLSVLRATTRMLGKEAELDRLAANLRVSAAFARTTLNWRPTKNLREGIEEMVRWFLQTSR